MEHVRWLSQPTLKNPVMVAAFTGWNDAGDAASGAIRHLIETWDATPLAEIDPEEFTDFATIRPHVRLSTGLNRTIVWPTVGLWHASLPGTDVILALGPEPAMRWRCFADQLVGIANQYKVTMAIALGALLADVPHSRPVQLIGTASDQTVIDRFDLQRSRYEGPTGIVGVIQDACTKSDLATASLWAAVPAYASQVTSPKASLALLDRLSTMLGSALSVGRFASDIADYEARVDAAVEADNDLAGYVRRLESLADSGVGGFEDDSEVDDDDLEDDDDDDDDDTVGGELAVDVDGNALMDEVERFLRDQGT